MGRIRARVDFDHWLDLASRDQSAFEAQRQKVIDQVISSASLPQQERLRRLQWRIDQERKRSASPMGACIRISRMMWDRMMGKGGLLDHLERLKQAGSAGISHTRSAEVTHLLPDRDPGC